MKKVIFILSFLLLSVLTTATVTADQSNHYRSDLYTFTLKHIHGTHADLLTKEAGVRMNIRTTELTPGDAVTVWWVVFNNPAACSNGIPDLTNCGEPDLFVPEVQGEVVYADGRVVGRNGRTHFAATLTAGGVPNGWFGNGLINPTGAEIHLVVRTHGQAIPGRVHEMTTTFAGGCNNVPPEHPGYGDGDPGLNHCEDIQFTVFQQD